MTYKDYKDKEKRKEYLKAYMRGYRDHKKEENKLKDQKAYYTDLLARMANWTCKLFLTDLAGYYKVYGKHPSLQLLSGGKTELAIEHLSVAFQRAGRSKRSTAYMLACSYEVLKGEMGRGSFAFVTNWILDIEACVKNPSKRNIEKMSWNWEHNIPKKWKQKIHDELPPTYKSYFDIKREEEANKK